MIENHGETCQQLLRKSTFASTQAISSCLNSPDATVPSSRTPRCSDLPPLSPVLLPLHPSRSPNAIVPSIRPQTVPHQRHLFHPNAMQHVLPPNMTRHKQTSPDMTRPMQTSHADLPSRLANTSSLSSPPSCLHYPLSRPAPNPKITFHPEMPQNGLQGTSAWQVTSKTCHRPPTYPIEAATSPTMDDGDFRVDLCHTVRD